MKISKRFKSLIPTGEIPSLFTNLSLPPVKLTRLESELETKMLNLDLKSCKLPDITRVIYLNAKTKRPKEAQMAFDYINELGLKPDLVAFNNLMAAYASGGNLERVQELMAELREKGLEPDMVTYSILINASVYKDVDLAFQYYQEYRKLGKPNQIILGTLIKGLIQDKQFDRAWKTFASAKSNEQPDTILYTTMIKMCFETQECEKAIDLFTEMMELNIEANEKTFNALIKTCGSRSDYYEYCFELLEKMIVNGFELNLETFEILLTITARNGDRQRAYKVWNHFIEKVELEKINDGNIYAQEPIVVNSFIMTQMLKLFDSLMGKSSLANKDEEEIGTIDQSIIPADSILPKLDSSLAVVEDANRIWDCTLDLAEKGYLEINGSILLARLKFLAQLTKLNSDEPIRNALEFMNTEFSSRNIPIKGGAYKALLRGAMKHKQSYQVGLEIYNQFKEWDEKLERDLKQVFPNLTLQEYEKKRVDQSRSAKTMLDCLLIVARGHCRNGNLKEAVELVEQCRKFRYPYYLPPITLHQVNNILTECQREADNGNLENLEKLQQLLPPVHHNLVTKVQKVLKKKNVGLGWWGWKVILSDKERLEMHKRNQKERREREKRQQELRSKGEFHAANRAKMVQLFKGYVDKE